MNRGVKVALWLCVAVALVVIWVTQRGSRPAAIVRTDSGDGRVFVNVPWKHLPHIDAFELVERSGRTYDSGELAGRPFVVSFFYASCPTICRRLNQQIESLARQFKNTPLRFVSITCDPDTDTPEVLARYARECGADELAWDFLTGPPHRIKEIGAQQFRVVVDKEVHTEDLLLVDRWGRYRDRFRWDDPAELKRFSEVVEEVVAECAPPLEKVVHTRNALAGLPHTHPAAIPWLREFFLKASEGAAFYSRDWTGRVWVGHFFFSHCPTLCPQQMQFVSGLSGELASRNVGIAGITTDPARDTPPMLDAWGRRWGADGRQWMLLTGDESYIRRVASEYFGAAAGTEHHAIELFVVDRWGSVRGVVDWRKPGAAEQLLALVDRLNAEAQPIPRPDRVVVPAEPAGESDKSDGSDGSDGADESDGA
jgi:cytochrome oxidase Cu insertion factor (SCO1/SenC/PrrC family)